MFVFRTFLICLGVTFVTTSRYFQASVSSSANGRQEFSGNHIQYFYARAQSILYISTLHHFTSHLKYNLPDLSYYEKRVLMNLVFNPIFACK